jgi:hypothetical protein
MDEENVSRILLEGLKINSSEIGHTNDARWALEYYIRWPIFVTFKPAIYEGYVLKLNLPKNEYTLYPDLPGLVEKGAYVGEDCELYWETDAEAKYLAKYLTDGEIQIEDLMENPSARKAAISLTQSAAILQNIPSRYISPYKQ